jgi:hypothetical protein
MSAARIHRVDRDVEVGPARFLRMAWLLTLVGAAIAPIPLRAADSSSASAPPMIYTCIDEKGNRLTADRPIPACTSRDQRVLNKDGSLKYVHPATLTAEERAEKELRERRLAEARAAQADAVRRDRNLIARFPNEATHNKAREAALDTVRSAMKTSELRLRDLAAERKPVIDEVEFYKGRAIPVKLRQQLEANDTAVDAQRSSIQNQEAELIRINRLYDAELDRLRKLWAGAQPGSLGPTPSTAEASGESGSTTR